MDETSVSIDMPEVGGESNPGFVDGEEVVRSNSRRQKRTFQHQQQQQQQQRQQRQHYISEMAWTNVLAPQIIYR